MKLSKSWFREVGETVPVNLKALKFLLFFHLLEITYEAKDLLLFSDYICLTLHIIRNENLLDAGSTVVRANKADRSQNLS